MITGPILQALGTLCDGPVRTEVPSARLVTLKAGGPLAALVEPSSIRSARTLWTFCHREGIPTLVRGRGSNLLVADSGFEGVTFQLSTALAPPSVRGRMIESGAGVAQATIAQMAAEAGLAGGEFLVGIPGTIGGALRMNAGCHGSEIEGLVEEVRSILPSGEIRTRERGECEFGVRRSIFQSQAELILSVRLRFSPGDVEAIRTRMRRDLAERRIRQPSRYPNCGSVFKNPPDRSAWKLIEDAGLRGLRQGGAQVSEKHTNFIVNRGGATADDILALMRVVQDRVFRESVVALEPELVVVGPTADKGPLKAKGPSPMSRAPSSAADR